MKRHVTRILLSILLLTTSIPGFCDDERKEGTHFLSKTREFSDGVIQLLPEFGSASAIRTNIMSHGTEYLVEFLYVLPSIPARYSSLDSLAQLFLDIDSLEGIEYWSGAFNRMYPYIRSSYRVESVGSRNALPPLSWPISGQSAEFIQYQRDTSFGANWYAVRVEKGTDSVLILIQNLTELKAFTKKTADAGGVLMQMALIPEAERTVLYCAVALKEFPSIGWSARGIAGSFNHRISAMEAWLADRIYGEE